MMRKILTLTLASAFAVASAEARDAEARDTMSATRAATLTEADAIRLDGRLDEPAWRRLPGSNGFQQREPYEGVPASEETEVRVLYDHQALYVGVIARDDEPEKIIARILSRESVMEEGLEGDHRFAGDDAVAILIDPFHDRRNAFVFATNPNGATFDALITDENATFNADWQGLWTVAAKVHPEGWSAEFRIPFRTLRYPAGEGERPWGFNVYRVIRRKNEEVLWSGWSREDGGFHRVSRAGRLEGLDELPRSGHNVELKLYGLAGALDHGPDTGSSEQWDLGVDAKWEVRPGLVLDATLNPDFAQVEADDQQINLTRFDLFYPEKRGFFLENAGIFDFGARGYFETPPFLMFFSRRIGLSEAGEPTPVDGGVRLSGRLGRQTIGVLGVATGPHRDLEETGFSALRWKRDAGQAGYVGLMMTDRRTSSRSNTVAGVDWSFWPTGSLNVQGFAAQTRTSGDGDDGKGDDYAYRVALDYQTDRVGFSGEHLVIGPDANAEMGFITRTDIRRSDVLGRYSFRPGKLGLRRVDLLLGSTVIEDLDHETQDWTAGPAIDFHWNSGERFRFYVARGFTRLDEGFDLGGQVPVGAGDYDVRQLSFYLATSAKRRLAFTASGDLFDTYDGSVSSVTGELGLSCGPHLGLGIGYTLSSVDLPGGGFDAGLSSLRVTWELSTRFTARALIQYNELEDRIFTNLILGFRYRPGSDLFFVFDETRAADFTSGGLVNRGVLTKLTYLIRL